LSRDELPLAGKVALVTGSGHGLGKVMARQLASLGARLVVNSFHSRQRGEETAAELVAAGHEAVHLWGSVANPRQLDQMFDDIESRFGILDIFVNNASNGFLGPLEHTTPKLWERSYRTNVIALHQGAMRAARLMVNGGHIITVTTPAAQRCVEYFGCQAAIKAAAESLARYLAAELRSKKIFVNAVSAGAIDGELLRSYPNSDRLIPRWASMSVMGRVCSEEEVVRFIVRLLVDPVAGALSGSRLSIDGGVSIATPGLSFA
jgi:enoyl-[acyl-carrier protein] reductase III